MKRLLSLIFIFNFLYTFNVSAQQLLMSGLDTLPRFSVINTNGNRNIISWVNNFQVVKVISIQRSKDSLTNYKTILNITDPMAVQNGYMDTKAPAGKIFYRIYIQLDKGDYLFTKAKTPYPDSLIKKKISEATGKRDTLIENGQMIITKTDTVFIDNKPIIVKAQPVIIKIDNLQWNDTIATPKPDYTPPKIPIYTPSLYVFTGRDGYVRVIVPEEARLKHYTIKFFDEDNTPLFELKNLKESDFKLDKTNFYHAGWFHFEIYDDDKLIEKHKFYLQKEF